MEVEETRVIFNEIAATGAKPFVVVGIPAFNEETTIARVILVAQKHADMVLVCDDGSSDMTGAISRKLGAYVVRHRRNLGYGASIKSLFKLARELNADVLVTLDADGQHNPKEIPNVVKPIVQGMADLVIGSRFIDNRNNKEMPLYRRIGAKVITMLVNGSSKKGVSDAQSGFRAYNRQVLELLTPYENGMGVSVEILLKASKHNLKICEVPSSCKYNNVNAATSTHHPLPHGIGVIISIIRYAVEQKPLTLLGIPGLLCLFLGLGFGFWMLQIYAINNLIITNIALASFAFVIIGFFMLSTAITLYEIARISSNIKNKK